MTNEIPKTLRRNYRKEKKGYVMRYTTIFGIFVIVTALWFFIGWLVPDAKAAEYTPIGDYPKSSKGTCMRFHDHPAKVVGGDLQAVRAFCKDNGITI